MLHSAKIGEPLIRTDVYISADQRDAMKRLGAMEDISMAEGIRRVLDRHIKRNADKLASEK